jgi:hypothetical protein
MQRGFRPDGIGTGRAVVSEAGDYGGAKPLRDEAGERIGPGVKRVLPEGASNRSPRAAAD